ncbi:hypothetical protein [Streptomyces canus]
MLDQGDLDSGKCSAKGASETENPRTPSSVTGRSADSRRVDAEKSSVPGR